MGAGVCLDDPFPSFRSSLDKTSFPL